MGEAPACGKEAEILAYSMKGMNVCAFSPEVIYCVLKAPLYSVTQRWSAVSLLP